MNKSFEKIDLTKPVKSNLQTKTIFVLAVTVLILTALVAGSLKVAGKEMIFAATHKDYMAYWMQIRSQADKKTASESAEAKRVNDQMARTEPSLLFSN